MSNNHRTYKLQFETRFEYIYHLECVAKLQHTCLIWEFTLYASCILVLFDQVRHVAGIRGGRDNCRSANHKLLITANCDKLMIDDTSDS